ncbi:hypothetical protein A6U85_25340 [Agrobacterium sp. 13-626]|nr:hypothetical protein A6U85_25340 [Agrobacterium sp. 13-626]
MKEYTNADEIAYEYKGVSLHGLIFLPNGGEADQLPGVLLVPAAFGIAAHARKRAQMIARLGYVVLVADHYGDGATFATIEEAMPAMGSLFADVTAWRGRLSAAFSALQARPEVDAARVAAVGFCVGGTGVLELACAGAPLVAAVSFHGGLRLSDPAALSALKAPVLICTGAADPLVPEADVKEVERYLRTGSADWQIHVYGNVLHAFTDPDIDAAGIAAAAYDRRADERSWSAMRSLFEEQLRPEK